MLELLAIAFWLVTTAAVAIGQYWFVFLVPVGAYLLHSGHRYVGLASLVVSAVCVAWMLTLPERVAYARAASPEYQTVQGKLRYSTAPRTLVVYGDMHVGSERLDLRDALTIAESEAFRVIVGDAHNGNIVGEIEIEPADRCLLGRTQIPNVRLSRLYDLVFVAANGFDRCATLVRRQNVTPPKDRLELWIRTPPGTKRPDHFDPDGLRGFTTLQRFEGGKGKLVSRRVAFAHLRPGMGSRLGPRLRQHVFDERAPTSFHFEPDTLDFLFSSLDVDETAFPRDAAPKDADWRAIAKRAIALVDTDQLAIERNAYLLREGHGSRMQVGLAFLAAMPTPKNDEGLDTVEWIASEAFRVGFDRRVKGRLDEGIAGKLAEIAAWYRLSGRNPLPYEAIVSDDVVIGLRNPAPRH